MKKKLGSKLSIVSFFRGCGSGSSGGDACGCSVIPDEFHDDVDLIYYECVRQTSSCSPIELHSEFYLLL